MRNGEAFDIHLFTDYFLAWQARSFESSVSKNILDERRCVFMGNIVAEDLHHEKSKFWEVLAAGVGGLNCSGELLSKIFDFFILLYQFRRRIVEILTHLIKFEPELFIFIPQLVSVSCFGNLFTKFVVRFALTV